MSQANQQELELEILVRARYPLIYLVSWEEERAARMLGALAERQGKRLFFWTVTQGMKEPSTGSDAAAATPKAALEFAANVSQPSIFVFKDFHAFMTETAVIRGLRDLVAGFKSTYKTLVILSPSLTIPVELEKDITVLDYDLPGPEELGAMFDQVVAASQNGSRFAVDLKPGEKERLLQSVQGLTLEEAESTLARAVVQNGRLDVAAIDVILKEIKQIVRKSRLLEYSEVKEEFGAIGGLVPLKDWLHKRGRSFSDQARAYGLPQPKGVLVLGVQGCGKSLTCKAISGLWKLPLLRLDMGQVFGGIVGQSEENMRRAIKTAEAVAPCVLWLDEIEKGLSGTGSSNMSDAGTTARVFSTFLTWLQEKTKPVFVAATANDISLLPPELLRKGRFDEIFFVDLPGSFEREQIFGIHLAKRRRDPKAFHLPELAKLASGFSGAEIEQAIVEALSDAYNQGRDITQADIIGALQQTVPLSRTMREDIERLRGWASSRARPASITSS